MVERLVGCVSGWEVGWMCGWLKGSLDVWVVERLVEV